MATIATPVLRHVRKTIAFDGGAGSGAADSDVLIFSITGGVKVAHYTCRCTESLAAGAGVDVAFGVPGDSVTGDYIFGKLGFNTMVAGKMLDGNGNFRSGGGSALEYMTGPIDLFDDFILRPTNSDITDGTIIIDAWYYPLTDDGALTGDDASPASGMLGEAIEGAHTVEDLLRIIAAAVAGKVSGAEGNAPVFRDLNDTKDRIIAATTADGNRTAVSHDPS